MKWNTRMKAPWPHVVCCERIHVPLRVFIAFSFAALVSLGPNLKAATLHVGPLQQYTTVQAAYAVAVPGDEIVIASGLFLERPPVQFNRNISVVLRPATGRAVITPNTPPVEDVFGTAPTLTGPLASAAAFNYAATKEGFEEPPFFAGFGNAFARSLWWLWTAPVNGSVVISSVGTDFREFLDVFRPSLQPFTDGELLWRLRNEVSFLVQSNVTYPIRISGEPNAYGQAVLNISYVVPPVNDDFLSSSPLAGTAVEVAGTTVGATRESFEPDHAGQSATNSVWFTWIAPTNYVRNGAIATVTSAGSDFDTVLAIYTNSTGTNLDSLVLVTNNEERAVAPEPPSGDSSVTFPPVPGTTYHIALDGARKAPNRRQQTGNYLLRLNYPLVSLLGTVTAYAVNTSDHSVAFSANLRINNRGFADTAALRVRTVARAGEDLAAMHRRQNTNELRLATNSFPAGLFSGGQQPAFSVGGLCPPYSVQDGRTNFWGVFAVLEEFFAGDWAVLDTVFLLYGDSPEGSKPILSYGVNRPTPAIFASSELNQLIGRGIRLANYATDFSTNQLTLIVQLDNATNGERMVTNAAWQGPQGTNFSVANSGVLGVGFLPRSFSISVTSSFNFSATRWTNSDVVPLYKRPKLLVDRTSGGAPVRVSALGESNQTYTLESALSLPTTHWQALQTVRLTDDQVVLTNLPSAAGKGFYRLRRSIP